MVNTRRTVSAASPEHAIPDPTSPTQGIVSNDIENEEREVNARIQRLEKLKADRERLDALHAELSVPILTAYPLPTVENSFSNLDRPNKDHDIKIEDLSNFNNRLSIQKRHQWLVNLELAFQAGPNRYSNDAKRILGALRFMDAPSTCEVFEEWTLSLIQNTTSLRADIRDEIERAHQLSYQDLYAREQHLTRETEDHRALNFFSKLQDDLKKKINRHILQPPSIRITKNNQDRTGTAAISGIMEGNHDRINLGTLPDRTGNQCNAEYVKVFITSLDDVFKASVSSKKRVLQEKGWSRERTPLSDFTTFCEDGNESLYIS
ncbi:hypothetical protein N7478_012630 [Penicillium angulare]|uniref:uncharacterized protein n=1 Tax=Penicillium angulare TaxID=116970 RepID=UPI0025402D80|nr:uncharacterized protein N7478_012630 [Penicillium angulare]KAJ5256526.1 hypothetical protein N7478_012630 [Penicillium angulare]